MRNLDKLLLASVLAFSACKRDRDRDEDTTAARETEDLDREAPRSAGPGPSGMPYTPPAATPAPAPEPELPAGTGSTAATPETAPTGTAPGTSATPNNEMGMPSDAADCPSTVKGAMTKVTSDDTATNVVLAITSTDDMATREIRDRATRLDARAGAPPAVKRPSAVTGTEVCPVMIADVTMTTKDIPGGVEVTLAPRTGAQTADLRQRVDRRIQATREWASKQDASGGGT